MGAIETVLAQYPAIIATVSALATVAAVMVALYLAKQQSRGRLDVFADIHVYISPDAQNEPQIDLGDKPQIISVSMSNVGPVPVYIPYWSSFHWSVPGTKRRAMQNPTEPIFRDKPIELLPGTSAVIVLSRDLVQHREMIGKLAATSWLGKFSIRHFGLTVYADNGVKFRAKIGNALREWTTVDTPSA